MLEMPEHKGGHWVHKKRQYAQEVIFDLLEVTITLPVNSTISLVPGLSRNNSEYFIDSLAVPNSWNKTILITSSMMINDKIIK